MGVLCGTDLLQCGFCRVTLVHFSLKKFDLKVVCVSHKKCLIF